MMSKTAFFSLVALLLFGFVGEVSAKPLRPIQLEVAGEAHSNGAVQTYGFRGYAGYARNVTALSTRWSLFGSAGGYLHMGSASVSDRRGVDNRVEVSRWAAGPEGRIGFAFGDRSPDLYLYLGAGLIRADAEPLSTELPEAGGHYGLRASLGFAGRGSWALWMKELDDAEGQSGSLVVLGFLVPNTLEFSIQQIGDEGPRYGGAIGWAF